MDIQALRQQIEDARKRSEQERERHFEAGDASAANYQDGWYDALRWMGMQLSSLSPDDVRIASLLRGVDIDTPTEGIPEIIRILIIYAHLGAWTMQGITMQPIAGEKAPPELLALLNTKPPIERVLTLVRGEVSPEWKRLLVDMLEMFDREADLGEPH